MYSLSLFLEVVGFFKMFTEKTGLNRAKPEIIEVISGPTSDYAIGRGRHSFHAADDSKTQKGK